ncbi:right-handed parallel beta-helix repeat-containing protein [Plebeiibacterium sediminum]|uniref:Right-handed parallel beta-helix repeat-containing protein n=1 Tax=Plebeiibacterium sediminum TaxID=2992112 RepID=A0AAE3M2E4_9BACT|nr:right-handed parallel beta-helix repeat-containing protein [Plebeiobacterium sediminum]MCW3785592.1 right-handed parallel beta-helix repeat-containing protein [Plebeiobacterium sediminum]
MIRSLFFLLLAFCCFINAEATNYYVSTSGSNSNNGTSTSTPFLTLSQAISVCSSGDDIFVMEGVYTVTSRIRIQNSGSASNRCSIQNYSGGTVILDFSSMVTADANQGILLNGNYWLLKGLTVKGAGDNGLLIDGGSYNVIKQCNFTENRDSGFQMKNGAAYNMVINCDSYYNYDPSGNGEDADGFAPKHAIGAGNYFYGCRAYDNSDDGWDMYQTINPVELVNCWAFSNGYNHWDDASFSGDGNAFKLGGDYTVSAKFVYRCAAFYNRGKGFDQNHNMGVITMINNTAYKNEGKDFQMYEATTAGEGHVAYNNICYPKDINFVSGSDLENNSWDLSGVSLSDDDFLSVDSAGVRGPRKADGSLPEINFLRLSSSSEMVDAGVKNDSISYNGTAPDLGAFESGAHTAVEEVNASANKLKVDILGNPFYDRLRIQIVNLPNESMDLKVQLINVSGKVVINKDIPKGLEYQLITLETSALTKGVYLLNVKNGRSSVTYKIYHY